MTYADQIDLQTDLRHIGYNGETLFSRAVDDDIPEADEDLDEDVDDLDDEDEDYDDEDEDEDDENEEDEE